MSRVMKMIKNILKFLVPKSLSVSKSSLTACRELDDVKRGQNAKADHMFW